MQHLRGEHEKKQANGTCKNSTADSRVDATGGREDATAPQRARDEAGQRYLLPIPMWMPPAGARMERLRSELEKKQANSTCMNSTAHSQVDATGGKDAANGTCKIPTADSRMYDTVPRATPRMG